MLIRSFAENKGSNIYNFTGTYPFKEISTQTARALVGPFRSSFYYLAVNIPGLNKFAIKLQPHTQNFLYEKKKSKPVAIDSTHTVLTAIDTRIFNHGKPEHFIGNELFQQFSQISHAIEQSMIQKIGSGKISEYVFFDSENKVCFLFFITDTNQLFTIKVDENINPSSLQIVNQDTLAQDFTQEKSVEYAVKLELAINKIVSSLGHKNEGSRDKQILRKVNSVSNSFDLLRNVDFEHEGEIISRLRDSGVHTIGELQAVFRLLFTRGLKASDDLRKIKVDSQLLQRAKKIIELAFPEFDEEIINTLLFEALREKAYFLHIIQQIRMNTGLVTNFMSSETFIKHSPAFKERHLASVGQTEQSVAEYMLAGFYLFKFEDTEHHESRSQFYLSQVPNYFEDIEQFLQQADKDQIPIPELVSSKSLLRNYFLKIQETQLETITEEKENVISKFDHSVGKVKREKIRHTAYITLLGTLKHKVNFPIAIDTRKGLAPTLIANFAMRRVKKDDSDYQLLTSTWLPNNGGYLLRDGEPLPDFNKQVSAANIESDVDNTIEQKVNKSLQYIFGLDKHQIQEGTTFDRFKIQENRIFTESPIIVEYLCSSSEIPENVRMFMNQISSGEFIFRILEKFGSIADQDPNIINRFFPEGLATFSQSLLYRYVFDFIRGIETNLQVDQGLISRLKAQFVGDWEPINITTTTLADLNKSKNQVLEDASHRIDWLNHETHSIKTLKDLQEKAEMILGWDTDDMKFLRWSPLWDIWNTLGGAWDCVCFSRKTIFNPRTFKSA